MTDFLYWKNIVPGENPPESIYALIECPKGTRNKYELSKSSNILLLDRVLHSSVMYPHDYGLIPGTLADDGDSLDILVIIHNPTEPMTLIKAKPLGVLIMEDEQGLDEKILSVAFDDPHFSDFDNINDLPNHFLREIKEFFRTYKNLEEPKYAEVKEWKNKQAAYDVINKSIHNFNEKYGSINQIQP
jgi:inorganic pyrophosphatase